MELGLLFTNSLATEGMKPSFISCFLDFSRVYRDRMRNYDPLSESFITTNNFRVKYFPFPLILRKLLRIKKKKKKSIYRFRFCVVKFFTLEKKFKLKI